MSSDTLFTWMETDIWAGRGLIWTHSAGSECNYEDVGQWLMSGTQQVRVEEVTGDVLTLTASPSKGPPGTSVRFTPGLVSGQPLTTNVNWRWTPDSGSATTPCGASATPCTMVVMSSGTMRIAAYVNGRMRQAKARVWIYTTFELQVDKPQAFVNDTATFTPMLDNKPISATFWKWMPSDSAMADSTACRDTAACKKHLRISGTMWAYLGIDGKVDSASRSVVVTDTSTPPPRMQLVAEPASADLGQPITFSADAGGASVAVSTWTFEGRTVACGQTTVCSYVPPFSGVMSVAATVQGRSDSASAFVQVKPDDDDSTTIGTDSTAVLRVVTSNGVEGMPESGVYLYHKNAKVPTSLRPTATHLDLTTILDDTSFAATATILMNQDRTLEAAADSNFLLDPLVNTARAQLIALYNDLNPGEALARFISWQRDAEAEYGAVAIDNAVEIAGILAFRSATDYARFSSFDSTLVGYEFSTDASVGSPVALTKPSDYGSDTIPALANRIPLSGGINMSMASAQQPPVIVFINGIKNSPHDASVAYIALLDFVKRASLGLKASLLYNPTSTEQRKLWGPEYVCDQNAAREEDSGGFKRLPMLGRRAKCTGRRLRRSFEENDYVEAYTQLNRIQHEDTAGVPQFVSDVEASIKRRHRVLQQPIVFVTHSQGNMMLAEAVAHLGTNKEENGLCTADLSLASPIPIRSFHLEYQNRLLGLIIVGDVLTLLPKTENDFPHYLTARAASMQQELSRMPEGPYRTSRQFSFGKQLHDVVTNYFQGADLFGTMKAGLESLVNRCSGI